MPTQVVIADDHPLMRSAIRQAVEFTLQGVQILETGHFDGLMSTLSARPKSIGLAVIDLSMPGMSGFVGLAATRSRFPSIPMLILSATEDSATVNRALQLGASASSPNLPPPRKYHRLFAR
jgi:DNA-binding NarL/FixJ family response regulator